MKGDEYGLYAPPPENQQALQEKVSHLLTKANCKDANEIDVSITQQQVVVNNMAKALGFRKEVSSTAALKARKRHR